MMPERIQRRRTKGWRMPEDAVYVGRPTVWGNPYEARQCFDPFLWAVLNHRTGDGPAARFDSRAEAVEESVRRYRRWMRTSPAAPDPAELRGLGLACWCPLGQPCHADVLLELANPNPGCDCATLCSMGPTCPGGILAGLPDSGCWRTA